MNRLDHHGTSGFRQGLKAGTLFLFVVLRSAAASGQTSGEPAAGPAHVWDPEHTRLLRNPFLPPGYTPPAEEAGAETPAATSAATEPVESTEEEWGEAEAKLSVRGISRMGDHVAALIGDRVVSPGETIELLHNGRWYRWRVQATDTATGFRFIRISPPDPDAMNPVRKNREAPLP